jgi:hypothetical protein
VGRYAIRGAWVKAGKYVQRGRLPQLGRRARADRRDWVGVKVPVGAKNGGMCPAEK